MTDDKLTDMGGVSRKGSDLLSVICHLSFVFSHGRPRTAGSHIAAGAAWFS
jgi:hypothetical protein